MNIEDISGLTNTILKIKLDGDKKNYILRIFGKNFDILLNRKKEN